jgi:hypothetical protein
MTKKPPVECSICGGPIDVPPGSTWTRGHNAQPVNDGRCCSECNNGVVLPLRIAHMLAQKGE